MDLCTGVNKYALVCRPQYAAAVDVFRAVIVIAHYTAAVSVWFMMNFYSKKN